MYKYYMNDYQNSIDEEECDETMRKSTSPLRKLEMLPNRDERIKL